jgi:2,4-dienoyl-CoA reductase-like NADH-dependent reductase (Old Yellow Enzyme family)
MPDYAAIASLFRPLPFGGRVLRNRIVMAPMTRRFSPGGLPGRDVLEYYRRRAEGGVGLIVTEGGCIDPPSARLEPAVPAFFRSGAPAAWQRIIAAVHAAGAAIIPQLWHGHLGESNAEGRDGLFPDEARSASLAEEYARMALRLRRIGFDGLEVQGGGKHTADLFVAEHKNGRPVAARIIQAIRSSVGTDFPIVLRVNEWRRSDGKTPFARDESELAALLRPCVEAGTDMLHMETSTCLAWQNGRPLPAEQSLAVRVQALLRCPAIAVGHIAVPDELGTLEQLRILALAVAQGKLALLAVGRALLADPRWVEKLRDGRLAAAIPYSEEMLRRLD